MRKKLLFIFLFLIMPMTAYADSISLDCPSSLDNGTIFTCQLSGSTDNEITAFNANIILSDNLTLIGFIPSDIWNGNGVDGVIDLYTEGVMGDFNLGTIKLQNNDVSSVTLTVDSIFFYGSDNSENTVSAISKNIEVIENNTDNSSDGEENDDDQENTGIISSVYLADIKIDNYILDFDKGVFSYTLEINDEDMLVIEPVLEDNSSSVSILGNENLENGSVITIKISSDDGSLQEYLINIVKKNLENSEENDYSFIFIIIIIILIAINVARIVMNRRKKDEE